MIAPDRIYIGETEKSRQSEILFASSPDGEETLYVDGGQAMQSWERRLMEEGADFLCQTGSEFLEIGLGFGYSALRISNSPQTKHHRVIEKNATVIERFRAHHPDTPSNLEIVTGDFFDLVDLLVPESVDGIFFDPALPMSVWNNMTLWARVTPLMHRTLRPGGILIPFFSTKPILREQFAPYFDTVHVHKRRYKAFLDTSYTAAIEGDAYIQCYIR